MEHPVINSKPSNSPTSSIIPIMSLDSESPSTSRDWFFPSPSYIHSSNSDISKTPTRRFSSYPRVSKPPKPTLFQNTSPTISVPVRDPKYAGVRRRIELNRRNERSTRAECPAEFRMLSEVSEEKTMSVEKRSTGLAGGRLNVRWQMAFSVA
ncbi:unnamed protein product, partial [Ilex paraguariensis]